MTSTWKIFEFAVAIFEVYLLHLFCSLFFTQKLSKSPYKFIFLITQASVILFNNFIFGVANPYALIISMTIIVITSKLMYDNNLALIALIALISVILVTVFEFLGVFIITSLFKVSPKVITEYTIYRAISSILIRILYLIFLLILKKLNFKIFNLKKIHIYEGIIVLLFGLSLSMSIFNLYKNEKVLSDKKTEIAIISIATIIFMLVLIKIINEIVKFSKEEVEWKLKESEYKRQLTYIKSMEDLTYNLRSQRHDFNHHIGCIYGLLQTNNISDAKVYTEKLVSAMQETNTIVNIDNAIISSILNFKLAIAKSKNIYLEVDVKIPKELSIDSTDISIILGNALDNAIEACEQCEEKNIAIKMYIQSDHLIIKICNSKNIDFINPSLDTTKADKENHGFGIENIRYVVEKYDGLLKIEDLGEKFLINIAL